ncbi:C2 calcium/lipid-binding plant phosphoribosyltransferase family protein [Rhynchospora pubera]|uniref:C2 calcium/lipid-binding plant phosphoribosyltransferase family protein n=1 Tax=Rhynchospora pubera TaxID=906938 RepID=A0AAV8BPE5_9POAL|nr:C2 calcium/lipid-binding plant phosphoribosyltransferase family protein [Rhynchospora pubera]
MMNNLKLGVEVVSAHDLMPKDSEGAANAYVELHFDRQRFHTTVKDRDLNPYWNESFYFNVSDPASLPEMTLEAWVYHVDRVKNSKSFLGKVRIAGTSFVNISDATVLHYLLEKRGIFSRVKGELGLKVFLTDDPTVRISDPVTEFDNLMSTPSEASNPIRENQYTTNIPTRAFQHLPRDNHTFPQQYQQQMQQQQPYYTSGSMPPPPLEVPGPSQYPTGDNMRQEPPQPSILRMFSSSGQQPIDYQLKETSPTLGGGQVVGGRVISRNKPGTYDLVEQMLYLFIRVVKARDLPAMDVTDSLDTYVEVKLGNYELKTRYFNENSRPEWDEVFAFPRERVQASVLEVRVKDKDLLVDDFVGRVLFDLSEVPIRVSPDSPLAPEWYCLQDKDGDKKKGEVMLAVWIGTQADEAFPSAHHADSIPIDPSIASTHIRGKVYPVPHLWYLRVGVLEAQDVLVSEKTKLREVSVKLRLDNQIVPTRVAQSRNANFQWNEENVLVAAEPFEEDLIVTIEDRHRVSNDEILGYVNIPLSQVQKRCDDSRVRPQWYSLRKQALIDLDQFKDDKFSSRIHLTLSLDGGYHVLDESTQYSSDFRPAMEQLWKPPIGVLELGILNIKGLYPMKTRDGHGTCDAYCVAKYGQKWVRTRTIVDNLGPRFNEQYTWDVHDHATLLTVGVFDNCQLAEKSLTNSDGHGHHKDHIIGKVRIRLSTLEAGRVYTHTYPLLVLHGSGVKKMGELHLAVRFTVTSLINSLYVYTRPLLPKMHYLQPLSLIQLHRLHHFAAQIVARRLSRAEPPLRKEVAEFMLDANAHLFSMRKSKVNFFRLMTVLSGPIAVSRWLSEGFAWKNPVTTVLVHVLHVILVCYPELILPTIFLYMFVIGLLNYRYRPRYPPHMNTKLSHADSAHPDELDEEFDTFPTSRGFELIRMRYDRLRSVAGRIQTMLDDVATHVERIQSLLSWRDPRATAMFLLFCIIAAITLYATPQVLAMLSGFYMMRHPRFRRRLPSVPMNFFRRLPARTDSLL